MQTRSNRQLLKTTNTAQPWSVFGGSLIPEDTSRGTLKSSIWRSIGSTLVISLSHEKLDENWEEFNGTIIPKEI